jgi:hypothetical protein
METVTSSSHKTARLPQPIVSPVPDRASTPFVTASIKEIRQAQRLRERIEEHYLNRPTPVFSFWSVGAD